MTAQVEVRQITDQAELKRFIYLPARMHRDHQNWIPPIYGDEWNYFNPKKNKAMSYCDHILVLAYLDGEVVGRIMGIINHRYNELRHEKSARFACLECRNDQDIAHALLGYIERWARQRDMGKIVGPLGFSDQDPEGFLIDGYEYPPTLATYYNFPYMISLLTNEGYFKDVDYVVYKVIIPQELPTLYRRIYKRVTTRGNFNIVEFTKRRQLRPFIKPIFLLVNESFNGLYGFLPLDEEDIDDLTKRYLRIIDPRFVKVITKTNQVIAFILGIPNMSEGIRRSKGRLFPFGLFHILRSAKTTKQLDLLLGAIREDYRDRGLDVLLGVSMIESAREAGFEVIDSHHELETNTKMRAEMERMGGEVYKRFRVFQKTLTNTDAHGTGPSGGWAS